MVMTRKLYRSYFLLFLTIIVACASFTALISYRIRERYATGLELVQEQEYSSATVELKGLGNYENSRALLDEAQRYVDYDSAVEFYRLGEYYSALQIFSRLGNFEDSINYRNQCYFAEAERIRKETYETALYAYEGEDYMRALSAFEQLGDYLDSSVLAENCEEQIERRTLANTITAGTRYSMAVTNDYTVLSTEYTHDSKIGVSGWTDIVSISGKGSFVAGLKKDGTVVTTGHEVGINVDTDDWTDIKQISVGDLYVAGLKRDGTFVSTGHNGDGQRSVDNAENIIEIATGWRHTACLYTNGTVEVAGYGKDRQSRTIKDWTDIVAVAAGGGYQGATDSGHTVGLKKDGTVVAAGSNANGQCNVDGWSHVIAIAAGDFHTVGLLDNQKVVTTDEDLQKIIDNDDRWTDIIAIAAGRGTILGLRTDHSVVAIGYNDFNQVLTESWTNVRIYEEWKNRYSQLEF